MSKLLHAQLTPDERPTEPGDLFDRAATLARVSGALLGESTAPRIGRYHLLGPVGRGGMGVVYAAYDEELDRKVALKVQPGAAADPVRREACIAEGRVLASVRHPNVVTVHEVGSEGDSVFLAMEFVDGQPLAAAGSATEREDLWSVLAQTAEGLAAAHERGIVHGDVKPANVLLDASGRAIVVDFGLARPVSVETTVPEGDRGDATGGRGFGGTPAYVAPEQASGRAMDPRSDQYAFAVMAWELLTGSRPFDAGNVTALQLQKESQPPNEDSPGASKLSRRELRAFVRAMDPNPQRRFASITDLVVEARPPARSLTLPLLAGGSLLLAVSAYFWPAPPAPPPDPCADASAVLDQAWPASARPDLAAPGDPKDLAADALRRTAVAAKRWEGLARKNCEAHARGELEDETYARLQACSERSSRAVTHAAERASAEPFNKHGALDALQTLATIELCAPHRHGIIQKGLQDGHLSVSGDGKALELGNRIGGLWGGGKHQEARALLPELRAAIEASADPLARAEGFRRIGIVAAEPAERHEALSQAMQIGMRYRLDHTALVSAGDLVAELRRDGGKLGEAKRVLDMTLLWSEAILAGEDAFHLQAVLAPFLGRLYNLEGIVASDDGRLDDAARAYRRSLEFFEDQVAWRPVQSAFTMNNLAMLWAQLGNDQQASKEFAEALAVVERYVGANSRPYASVALNVADHAAAVGDWERVDELFERVREGRRERGQQGDSAPMLLLGAGRWWAQGQAEVARTSAEQAAELFAAKKQPLMSKLAALSAASYDTTGTLDVAAHFEALEKAGAAIDFLGLGHRMTVDALLRGGRLDEASKLLDAGDAREPALYSLSDLDGAHRSMLRARLAHARGDDSRALEHLSQAEALIGDHDARHPAMQALEVLRFELGRTSTPPSVSAADLVARVAAASGR